MSSFDDLLDQMVPVIANILRTVEAGEPLTLRRNERRGLFNVSYNLSITSPSDMLGSPAAQRGYQKLSREPLVDIIDSGKNIKVIILFPGVNKEDIDIEVKETSIAITIVEEGRSHHLEIPCNVKASLVSARSENGVMEIVLKKRSRRKQEVRQ